MKNPNEGYIKKVINIEGTRKGAHASDIYAAFNIHKCEYSLHGC